LNREQINPFDLPSVPLEKLDDLPNISAIYVANSGEEILYIGKTTGIQQRWVSHHRFPSIETYPQTRIVWLDVGRVTTHQLSSLEGRFIERWGKTLNSSPVNASDVDLSYLSSPQWQGAMQRAENPTSEDYVGVNWS
jgi:hypothetical protein